MSDAKPFIYEERDREKGRITLIATIGEDNARETRFYYDEANNKRAEVHSLYTEDAERHDKSYNLNGKPYSVNNFAVFLFDRAGNNIAKYADYELESPRAEVLLGVRDSNDNLFKAISYVENHETSAAPFARIAYGLNVGRRTGSEIDVIPAAFSRATYLGRVLDSDNEYYYQEVSPSLVVAHNKAELPQELQKGRAYCLDYGGGRTPEVRDVRFLAVERITANIKALAHDAAAPTFDQNEYERDEGYYER